jgi:uncharacterized protein
MKSILQIYHHLALLVSLMTFTLPGTSQTLEGIWLGKLQISTEYQLTVAFEIKQDTFGMFSARMHSLDQNAYDIPAELTQKDSTVRLTIDALNGVYEAILQENTLKGYLTQGTNNPWLLHMKKVESLPRPKPNRPQEPVKPLPYKEEEVSYQNSLTGVSLAGTFTYPASGSHFPAVVLISGSGPNDRDQSIFGHKTFLVLSDYLTRAGFAVLRIDDRGVGKSTGDFASASMTDLASDVVAGVQFLKSRAEVNQANIGLIGHSLGADIAPLAATSTPDVAFVVMMSGSAIPLYEGIYEQCRLHYADKGISQKGIQVNENVLKAVFESLKEENDTIKATRLISRKFRKLDPQVAALPEQERKELKLSSPLQVKQFESFFYPAMRKDLYYDPRSVLEKLTLPVLAINGSLDKQVHPQNLQRIAVALAKAGNQHAEIKEFAGKNHLFQHSQTGSIAEYATLEETFSPEVMDYMVTWMKRQEK